VKKPHLQLDTRLFRGTATERLEPIASIERCRREISEIEALILAGHPDVQGMFCALADRSAELKLMESEWHR
jgi:hypothetical protein